MAKKRTKLNPNATVPEGARDNATQAKFDDADLMDQEQLVREAGYVQRELMEENMTARQVDANRDVPRTIRPTGDRAARQRRPLPDAGAKRTMLSSRRKKDLSSHKKEWQAKAPRTRARVTQEVLKDQNALEEANERLRAVRGRRSRLDPKTQEVIHRVDLTIADFERNNTREHLVYSTLRAPANTPAGRERFRYALQRMALDGESMTFDGYIPATHSLGNVGGNSDDIVMEMQTYSGAYLGTSDSTPDANHVVGRGRRFKVMGVQDVEYVKPDGSTGRRVVVQMRDVSDEDGN